MSYCWLCNGHHDDLSGHALCSQQRYEELRERVNDHQVQNAQPLTGGSADYYKIAVERPSSGGEPYTLECFDVIEALGMTFAEGNVMKAVWRHALARRGVGKQGNTVLYEAEKIKFFAEQLVRLAGEA